MNLTKLRLLAEEAHSLNDIVAMTGPDKAIDYFEYCTPERILALLRVAEAAQFAFQQWPTIAFEELSAIREALRDLEATP